MVKLPFHEKVGCKTVLHRIDNFLIQSRIISPSGGGSLPLHEMDVVFVRLAENFEIKTCGLEEVNLGMSF